MCPPDRAKGTALQKTGTAVVLLFLLLLVHAVPVHSQGTSVPGVWRGAWVPDNGDGTYTNPVLFADYSDPDLIRVGDDFYLTASSFNQVPGLPILHSRDLVNWTMIGHALQRNSPDDEFITPRHGGGVWAPSIRHHRNEYFIFWGDPDYGIFMTRSRSAAGPWVTPVLVKAAKGRIDPCPFWDDNGEAYLVHAWAGSRAGIKSILTICRMSPDGATLLDDGVLVFDGHMNHPTIEGPKLYKRNGYYYIFAPAGGVKTGWQSVLRSRNIYGPYESRIVMHQGQTSMNGPHQGGWVELRSGESWFMHFQDREAYGRVVHLQPMRWIDGWPVIGNDSDGDGTGEPVITFRKPNAGRTYPIAVPQTTDEFEGRTMGPQWQWSANPQPTWAFLSGSEGFLRLYAASRPVPFRNLWDLPNLLTQKFPAPRFTATARMRFWSVTEGEKAGLVVTGTDYASLSVRREAGKSVIVLSVCEDAQKGATEREYPGVVVPDSALYLRVVVKDGARCTFGYSTDGIFYSYFDQSFVARPGVWIGSKVGLYCTRTQVVNDSGFADFDWFRVE